MLGFDPKIHDIGVSQASPLHNTQPSVYVYVIEFGHPGSSTLPRATTRSAEAETGGRNDKVAAATSSTSLYDNVAGGNQGTQLFSFAILK